jgi:hypothetical protein
MPIFYQLTAVSVCKFRFFVSPVSVVSPVSSVSKVSSVSGISVNEAGKGSEGRRGKDQRREDEKMKVNRKMSPFVDELEAFYKESGIPRLNWRCDKNYFYLLRKGQRIIVVFDPMGSNCNPDKNKKWWIAEDSWVVDYFYTLTECLRYLHLFDSVESILSLTRSTINQAWWMLSSLQKYFPKENIPDRPTLIKIQRELDGFSLDLNSIKNRYERGKKNEKMMEGKQTKETSETL